ncbi:MAG: hypothetical protein K6L81_16145 [Agarilytica sp.]
MLKVIMFISIFLMPSFVLAGWTNSRGAVTNIYSHNGIVIIHTGIDDGPCDNKGGFWWDVNDPDSDIMLSLALVSFSTGSEIAVVYDSDAPNCTFSNSHMTHLHLVK